MNASRDYLPGSDAELRSWAANFRARIVEQGGTSPDGSAWGLSALQIAQYSDACDVYSSDFIRANQSSTRTKPAIQTKNDSRKVLKALTRQFVRIVQSDPSTTDTDRKGLKITIRDEIPTPIHVPDTPPTVKIAKTYGRYVTIRLFDAPGSLRKAKPRGAIGAFLLTHVGEQPPTAADAWRFAGGTSRTTHTIEFPHTIQPGTKVWITAQWFNRRIEAGLPATPVFTHIGSEGTQAAAA